MSGHMPSGPLPPATPQPGPAPHSPEAVVAVQELAAALQDPGPVVVQAAPRTVQHQTETAGTSPVLTGIGSISAGTMVAVVVQWAMSIKGISMPTDVSQAFGGLVILAVHTAMTYWQPAAIRSTTTTTAP